MNKLLKLGLKSQSLRIITKYLPNPVLDQDLAKEIFDYSVREKKLKNLEFLFNEFELSQFLWFEEDLLPHIEPFCDSSSLLLERKTQYEIESNQTLNAISIESAPSSDSLDWEWESESFDLPNKVDDSHIIEVTKLSHAILSKTDLADDSLDILAELDVTIPVTGRRRIQFSKFIQANKKELKLLYYKLGECDGLSLKNITVALQEQFGRDVPEDLIHATHLSANLHSDLAAVDFYSSTIMHYVLPPFDEWLNELDALLVDSKKPIIKNYLLNEYYREVGKSCCDPLTRIGETEILDMMQQISNELVAEHKKLFLAYSVKTRNDISDFKLCVCKEGVLGEGMSDEELEQVLYNEIEGGRVFFKPLSIYEYFSSFSNTLVKRRAMRLRDLAYKFQTSNLRLVLSQAKKYLNWDPNSFFDLIQAGNLSLLSAIDKFDPHRGNKFSTYAMWWIKQSMYRYMADNQAVVRVPVHYYENVYRKLIYWCSKNYIEPNKYDFRVSDIREIGSQIDCSIDELESFFDKAVIHVQPHQSFEPSTGLINLTQDEDKQLISFILNRGVLTDKELTIIALRFGLGTGEGLTLEEVGVQFSVTRERIRQIEAKALKKLRIHMKTLEEYRDQVVDEEEIDES